MKAIRMEEFGEPDVLQLVEVPTPEPGPGQVLVKVHAAGVNPAECYIRTGTYAFFHPDLPYTPGFDAAGEVAALGAEVTGLSEGQRVYVSTLLSRLPQGTYAEYVLVDARDVHPLPDALDFAQGAAVGVPATTGWRALFQRGRLTEGERVLIHGASGGVGLLAVQLAAAAGATVVGSAGSAEGAEAVRQAGAHHVVDHGDENHLTEVAELTDGGVDLVLEMLADRNLASDFDALRTYGRIVIIGSRGSLDFTPRAAMIKEADILGTALWNTPREEWDDASRSVADALAAGSLVPHVGRTYPLDQAARAQHDILNDKAAGKVVLEVTDA